MTKAPDTIHGTTRYASRKVAILTDAYLEADTRREGAEELALILPP